MPMTTPDKPNAQEFRRPDRRLGKLIGYGFLVLFALAITAAVLQATLGTPKNGTPEIPPPAGMR
ncbi:hypothetical protein [Luteimonas kalidii]|uniref:Uncharacterized protein n=1 Tax=Luteimonas kalidii TaxID=3042025 RepID=A0ABT6JXF1_9GAMM|nr:hypothetical protein [Luteimonas kalidii]MDH5834826.1 hypothetical protein [Luteimonas kalidii]